ncbi:MAG TPA: hypothetical protein VF553_15275 [Pyrinomonadaceae bacterium]|jgi:hypothetical protein
MMLALLAMTVSFQNGLTGADSEATSKRLKSARRLSSTFKLAGNVSAFSARAPPVVKHFCRRAGAKNSHAAHEKKQTVRALETRTVCSPFFSASVEFSE